jgi:hypothetical protein
MRPALAGLFIAGRRNDQVLGLCDIMQQIAAKIGEKLRFGSQIAFTPVSILRHMDLSPFSDKWRRRHQGAR